MTYYVGIDPGKNGGICILDPHGEFYSAFVMPNLADKVDARALFDLLQKATNGLEFVACLEKAHAMPKQGVVSVLNYGTYYGYCEMALAAMGASYELVLPQKWQKDMHSGIQAGIKDPKLRSALKAQQLLGLDRFTVGKAKKPHDGLVDAFLLATYLFRLNNKRSRGAA